MKIANRVMKREESQQVFLTVVFVIYILFDIQLPDVLAKMVSSLTGNIVVALLALYIFVSTNPILGGLGLIVAYLMVHRSTHKNSSQPIKLAGLSEEYKLSNMKKYNNNIDYTNKVQPPETLEQEMVNKRAPMLSSRNIQGKSDYKPVLSQNSYAAPVDYEGSV
tara:strand:- start:246 stop:737 length:492 start_codon:yes stop_codon:yes gene_type:complete